MANTPYGQQEEKGQAGPVRPGLILGVIQRQNLSDLLRVSVRGTRRRCALRRGLVFMSTGSQAERSGQKSHNHDRFQKFQSISPPFPAGCFVCLGKELHGSNAFLDFFGCAQIWLLSNQDRRFCFHKVKQLNHICVAHSNATVARRLTDFVLVPRPVNVNEAIAGIGVVFVQTIQPQNPRHHQILRGRERIVRPKRHAAAKNRSVRRIAADLFCDPKSAGRRFEAALFGPNPKTGSGYRVGTQSFVASFQNEALIFNRDFDLARLWRQLCLAEP